MGKKLQNTRPIKTALQIGFEKAVHGVSPLVAESGAWCNDLGHRWHKEELR